MSNPLVSIVIVTYNGLPLLRRFLPDVLSTRYPNLEVLIADNASTDGTGHWLRANHPSAVHVKHPRNWLFCRGNNEAIKHARGKYVLLLNNDVQVMPEWLAPLVDTLEKHPNVAAVQPKMLQMDGRTFEYAGAAGGFVDSIGYPFAQGRIFDTMETDHGQYDRRKEVFWASGAAVLINRACFEEVGRLDERFEMHMEEIDLCWRLHRAGYRVMMEPRSTVKHLGGSSLPRHNPRKAYYNFRNSLLMLFKHTPKKQWPALFAKRFAFDIAAAGRFAARRQFDHVRSIVQAYQDAHKMKTYYDDQRPSTNEAFPLPFQGCIAAEYYLKARTTCQNLPESYFHPPFQYSGFSFAAE